MVPLSRERVVHSLDGDRGGKGPGKGTKEKEEPGSPRKKHSQEKKTISDVNVSS